MTTKKSKSAGIGVGLAAAGAAAAVGAYLLTGKNGKQNIKKVKGWIATAKRDVIKEAKKAGALNRTAYNEIVETVTKGYQGIKNIDPKELAGTVKDLKAHWSVIKDELVKAGTTVGKNAKTAAKTVQSAIKKPSPRRPGTKSRKK